MDEYLKWNPADYEGITQIQLPPHKLWTPDIFLFNHQVGSAAHQVVTKMAGDIIEEENVRGPKLVWRKLNLGDALIVSRVPLQVLIHPLEVEPHQRSQDTPLIVIFHNLFQHCLHIHHNWNAAVQHRDEHGVVALVEVNQAIK